MIPVLGAADRLMPQLGATLNPEAMLGYFRSIQRPDGLGGEVLNCRLERFRYSPEHRAIVLYQLNLRDPRSGDVWQHWASGVTYPGDRAERLYHRLLKQQGTMINPLSPCLPNLAFIPELHQLVQFFPYDRYLPSLPTLMIGPPAALERVYCQEMGPGDWHLEQCQVDVTRYRPFIGATLRHQATLRDLETGRTRTACFYLKLYRDNVGAKVLRFLASLGKMTANRGVSFAPVRAVAYLEDFHLLVLSEAPGQSLQQCLVDNQAIPQLWERVAQALAELHQGDWTMSRRYSRDVTLSRTRKAGGFIQWASPALHKPIDEILQALESRYPYAVRRPTHLDFKPDHVFINDGKIVLIDLDDAAIADPGRDVATLLARMEALVGIGGTEAQSMRMGGHQFVEAYFSRVPRRWRTLLAPNYACAALDLARYFVQHQLPDWPLWTQHFVERAGSAICDPQWRY